jgi:hypothetical protein
MMRDCERERERVAESSASLVYGRRAGGRRLSDRSGGRMHAPRWCRVVEMYA